MRRNAPFTWNEKENAPHPWGFFENGEVRPPFLIMTERTWSDATFNATGLELESGHGRVRLDRRSRAYFRPYPCSASAFRVSGYL